MDASIIRPDLYFEIIKTIKQMGQPVFTATPEGTLYCDSQNKRSKIMEDIGEKVVLVDSIETEHLANSSVCMSVLIEEDDPLEKTLRERFSEDLQLVRSGKFFFDLLNKDCTKGKALNSIINNMNISEEEIAAIGDSYNDISLFESCGLKIAVSNACDKLKEVADIVVKGNDECGFAQAVNEYIL
jgi:hydroxymethylpyrimidine pyrophosphatase-like HAD family hydrolase